MGIGPEAVEFVLEGMRAKEASPEAAVERVVREDGKCEDAEGNEDALGDVVIL